MAKENEEYVDKPDIFRPHEEILKSNKRVKLLYTLVEVLKFLFGFMIIGIIIYEMIKLH